MDKKKIIIILVVLIAIVIIMASVAIALLQGGDSYASRIESGYRYLLEGDFNNAILQFRYAIEEDGTREDAYYGLYQAYLQSGDTELAVTVLRVGISGTGSALLQQLLDSHNIALNAPAETQAAQSEQPAQVDDKSVTAVLNTDVLTFFASATYGDYTAQYGLTGGSYTGTQFSQHVDSLAITLVYHDSTTERVIDTGRGVPYNQFLPNEIRMDNITSLFGGVSRLTYEALTQMSGISKASMNGNTITFTYGGCDITIICTEEGVITPGAENYIVPNGNSIVAETKYSLVATVVDATNGAAVMGAKVDVYSGYNTFGQAQQATTDGMGKATINLEENGVYTVVISKNGYIEEQFEVYIMSNLYMTQETFCISPTMSGNGIRFVLSWGASPTDLDSYLIGTAGDGTYVNVNYTSMKSYNGAGVTIAELDVDDVTGFGPETTTLYDISGSYEFFIDDYTDSGTISSSGATVKIYVGSALYTTVTIPGGISDLWHVCTIVDGNITVTNRSM